MDTFCTNDGIEGLEGLGCEEYGRTEPPYMVGEMDKNMEFRFVEPAAGPPCSAEQELFDFGLKQLLAVKR